MVILKVVMSRPARAGVLADGDRVTKDAGPF